MEFKLFKRILCAVVITVSSFNVFSQCACLYYNASGEFTCILYANCSQPNLNACASLTTASSPKLCSVGNPCPQSSGMNSNCGGCMPNGACWYNGNSCNASTACEEIGSIIMPVELVNFNGYSDGSDNNITWSTVSENNNSHFTVEHSTNGEAWTTLILINGVGNSTDIVDYRFIHASVNPNFNYYRLNQVDFDGATTNYSAIVIDNRVDKPSVMKTVNLLGQVVDENYKGLVVIYYNDGSNKKLFQD